MVQEGRYDDSDAINNLDAWDDEDSFSDDSDDSWIYYPEYKRKYMCAKMRVDYAIKKTDEFLATNPPKTPKNKFKFQCCIGHIREPFPEYLALFEEILEKEDEEYKATAAELFATHMKKKEELEELYEGPEWDLSFHNNLM